MRDLNYRSTAGKRNFQQSLGGQPDANSHNDQKVSRVTGRVLIPAESLHVWTVPQLPGMVKDDFPNIEFDPNVFYDDDDSSSQAMFTVVINDDTLTIDSIKTVEINGRNKHLQCTVNQRKLGFWEAVKQHSRKKVTLQCHEGNINTLALSVNDFEENATKDIVMEFKEACIVSTRHSTPAGPSGSSAGQPGSSS